MQNDFGELEKWLEIQVAVQWAQVRSTYFRLG